MSLNGLDNAQVAEAYTAASAEAGGWFLLKYASRDEIEILSKGNGGIAEMRNAVAAYDETNPLYGYLKYRRRNVLVKYLPEDCSRLIQARVAVHFNAVCERFSPYDSQFVIATSDELRDSRLSAACSLHAATGSNSSAGSNGKKHLMEIAEEDEEEVQQPAKRQSLIKESADEDKENQDSSNKRRSVTGPDVTLNKNSTEPKFSETDVPNFVGATDAEASASSAAGGENRRLSSQSSRAEVFTSYSAYSAYAYSKPKVKLGPRPSLETNTRPQTAGNFRPVSSIPAGFKLFGKNGSVSSGPGNKGRSGRKDSIGSQNSGVVGSPQSELTEISFATLPIPEEPNSSVKNAIESARPNTSSGVSTKSGMTMGSKAAMTPEKARLKKAMALREKKKKKAAREAKETLDVPDAAVEDKSDVEGEDELPAEAEQTQRAPMVKADSGISINASPVSTKDSETTQESRPTSPVEEQSTKASSVSEATEQAVEGKDEEPSSSGSTPKPTEAEAAVPAVTEPVEASAAVEETTAATGPELDEKPTPEEPAAELEVKAEEKEVEDATPSAATASTEKAEVPQIETDEPEPIPVTAPADDIPVVSEEAPAQTTQPSTQPETQTVPDPIPQPKDDSVADTITQPTKQSSTRRRPIEPIRTDLAQKDRPVSTTQTELNFSDNDELLDELHSATVEEAKPMLVTKTPLTPVFPGKPSAFGASPTSPQPGANKPTVVRTVSNPVRGNLAAINSDVSQSSARSVSQGAAYLHQITQQRNGDSLAKKQGNMGSTIANRIKALELLSVNTAETASPPGSRPSSQFFSVKKDRVPSRSPSLADRANSFSKDSRPDTAQSRRESPEESRVQRERSGSISSRLSMFEPADSPGNTPRGRPETISVTAKIIRDSPSTSRNRDGPVELKQSPLLVDHHHQEPSTPDLTVNEPETRPSDVRDTDSRRSSFSMMRDFLKEGRKSISSPSTDNLHNNRPPSTHQNTSFSHRLSISSRRSLSKDRAAEGVSTASILSDDESTSDKKPSRTSRLMRRLSSLSGSRNSPSSPHQKLASPPLGTPTVTEEVMPSSASPIATYMGDVNVQFPDTLLWKRRNMYLDSQGYVILSALPQTQGGSKNKTMGVKRYHLGEFRTPYAPDVEVQELPNSVVLDLVEGSSVQVACEDRTGQREVLQTLREAHAAHAGQ